MASIFPRWKLALERFGLRGCWDQMFAAGTVKIGVKIGKTITGTRTGRTGTRSTA